MARKSTPKTSSANLGFEQKMWLAADNLRNNMDAAEPERSGDSQPQTARRESMGLRVKYISESFDKHHGTKAEAEMQNEEVPAQLPHSSFALRISPAFGRDLHPDLRADYDLATAMRDSAITKAKPSRKACRRQDSPMPFNYSDWQRKDDDGGVD